MTSVVCLLQVFKQPWPGIMRTVYGNHERFETTYFKKFPGYYCTGDGEISFFHGIFKFSRCFIISSHVDFLNWLSYIE